MQVTTLTPIIQFIGAILVFSMCMTIISHDKQNPSRWLLASSLASLAFWMILLSLAFNASYQAWLFKYVERLWVLPFLFFLHYLFVSFDFRHKKHIILMYLLVPILVIFPMQRPERVTHLGSLVFLVLLIPAGFHWTNVHKKRFAILSLLLFSLGPLAFFLNHYNILYLFLDQCYVFAVYQLTRQKISKIARMPKGFILGEAEAKRFYKVMTLVMVFSGLASFITQYFIIHQTFLFSLSYLAIFWVFPVVIQILQALKAPARVRDVLVQLLFSVGILFFDLKMYIHYPISIWVIPSTLILVSVLFNNRSMILAFGFTTVLGTLLQWLMYGRQGGMAVSNEYITKILYFGILLITAIYVNRVYLLKLSDLERRSQLQKLVTEVAANLSTTTDENIDQTMQVIFEKIGIFFNAIQITLTKYDSQCWEWKRADLSPNLVSVQREIPIQRQEQVIGMLTVFGRQGQAFPENVSVLNMLGNLFSDALIRNNYEQHLVHIAYHDSISNLPNHASLSRDFPRIRKDIQYLAILNIKDFKLYNLSYGYKQANELIQSLVKIFEHIDCISTMYHFTIDRFVFLFGYNFDAEGIQNTCNPLLHDFLDFHHLNVAIGLVDLKDRSEAVEVLVKYASTAASYAKNEKRLEFSIFDDGMQAELDRNQAIEDLLSRVVSQKGSDTAFKLQFQPIIDTKTKEITSFEALARLSSVELGSISPLEFIAIAERSQLIYDLGFIIMDAALQFLSLVRDAGYAKVRITVNVSLNQIIREEFVVDLIELVENFPHLKGAIELELTESMFAENLALLNEKIISLKDAGFTIALDDFGTGYSSFAREAEIDFNVMKLDKQFIDHLPSDPNGQSIVGDIISMAHKLGHEVVAEGVESENQYQYLLQHQCDTIQGYLFSKPLDTMDALNLLQKGTSVSF